MGIETAVIPDDGLNVPRKFSRETSPLSRWLELALQQPITGMRFKTHKIALPVPPPFNGQPLSYFKEFFIALTLLCAARFLRCFALKLFTRRADRQRRWLPYQNKDPARLFHQAGGILLWMAYFFVMG